MDVVDPNHFFPMENVLFNITIYLGTEPLLFDYNCSFIKWKNIVKTVVADGIIINFFF